MGKNSLGGGNRMSKPKIQTMKELSQAIGISRPTLARFFEDETSVLPSTADKIKKRLEDVDYVYNFLATRQNRKSTGLIGVVVPHFKDLFYASLLDAIETAARTAGITIITQSSNGQQAFEDQAVRKLRSMNVDGAIIAPLGAEVNDEVFTSAGRDFPIVFVDSRPPVSLPEADFIGTDNANSIGLMVDYLCRSGPAPVYLNMPKLNINAVERHEAYLAKMQALGHKGEIIPTPENMDTWDFERYGFEIMDAHFAQGRYVDATIMCANDRLAIGAIRAANNHGLFSRRGAAGRSLRIAGHDDHPLSQYIFPAVTTVVQDVERMGKEAVDLLKNRVRDGKQGASKSRLLEGRLKIRESA